MAQTEKHVPAHTPNHISAGWRCFYAIASPAVIAYGAYGIWIDDLFIPGKRSTGVHLQGLAAWLVFAAILCMAANMVSVIVDHYDKRNNETRYRLFASVTSWAGWILFCFGILHHILITLAG